MDNVENKVVVITGASSGMGEAAGRHIASLGGRVILGARRADRIDKLAAEITQNGGKALAVAADVTRRSEVQKLIDRAVEAYGRVDVLINNAGLMPLSPLEDLKFDEWDRMIDVNLKGVLNGIAAALPYMKQQKAGQIITTASVAAYKAGPTFAVYPATKFALRGLMEGLRVEVKPYNIRTALLSPGAVKTELLDHISDEGIQAGNRDYVGKVGISPDSYASIAAFLISQPADVDINEVVFRPTAQEM